MAVPAMSLELHERGIHAVWTGGPGPRPGGTGVTAARQDAPAPQTPKPRNRETPENYGCAIVRYGPSRCGRYDQEARRRSTAGRMRSRASARLTPDISRESYSVSS